MKFEGDKEFPQPPADLWARLSDARFLVQCIPGSESVELAEPARAVCKLRPGFSFARGTLEIKLEVVEAVPGQSVRVAQVAKGIGSSTVVEVTLRLLPQGGGTRVHWIAEIKELAGLLKAVPQGLIKASAQKVIGDVWTEAEPRLKAGQGPP